MKKIKQISWITIFTGIISLLSIILSDWLRGRVFYFGYFQIFLLFISLIIITIGYTIGYQPQIWQVFLRTINSYRSNQWMQIREQLTFRKVTFVVIIIFFFSIFVTFYYTIAVPIVRSFPDYIGAGSTVTLLQLLTVLSTALICILPNFIFAKAQKSKWIDLFISFLILFVAYKLWTSLPIATNWLMRQANSDPLVIYPFSDPRRYDINVLAMLNGKGYGFGTPIQRPFYTFFWTILHILFNHNYVDMVYAQVTFFAVLPVIAFQLGNKFAGRYAGVVISGMIIFHEYNQIILSSHYTVITVQMIMSEFFIELFLIILTIISLYWLQDIHSKEKAIMTGTAFGLVILLRTQAIVLLGVFLIYFMFFKFCKKQKISKVNLYFLLSFVLILIPWLTRNYIQNGYFSMDDPKYFNTVFTGNGDNETFTGIESDTETSLSQNIKSYFFNRTGDLLTRTFAFFCNDIANSMYQFPWTTQFNSLDEYINNGASPYPHPYDRLNAMQIIMASFHFLIIAIGLLAAINRYNVTGAFPILLYIAYCLSGDIFGYTAHRFIQPVEWVFFLYWGFGFTVLLAVFIPKNFLFSKSNYFFPTNEKKLSILAYLWIGAAVLVAILIPTIEIIIPDRENSLPDIEKAILALDNENLAREIIKDDNSVLIDNTFAALKGKALYPLHLEDITDWYNWNFDTHWYVLDYERVFEWSDDFIKAQVDKNVDILLFQLMNDNIQDIIVNDPQYDRSVHQPFLFNNSEIFVYGCVRTDHIEAYYIQIIRHNMYYEIHSADPLPSSCSKIE